MGLISWMNVSGMVEEQRRLKASLKGARLYGPLPSMVTREERNIPAMPQEKTVCLLENRDDQCTSLARTLEAEGFEVAAFRNAEEALALVHREPPGLLIIGCTLPGTRVPKYCNESGTIIHFLSFSYPPAMEKMSAYMPWSPVPMITYPSLFHTGSSWQESMRSSGG